MAISYSSGRSHFQGTVPVTAAPLTMSCWFNVPNQTGEFVLMSIGDFDTNNYFGLTAGGNYAGDPVIAYINATGGFTYAQTSAGYTANTWQHAAGVFTATNSRTAYLSGGNSGNNTATRTPTNIDYIALAGVRVSNAWYAGANGAIIAECAIWNAALNTSEVEALAKGFRPSLVRPQNLRFYAPLVREIIDVRGGLSLTTTGNTVAVHPRRVG